MIGAENISKIYPSGRGVVNALSNISFSTPEGATLAIAGKSGSGKTTLLNCLGGLERPDTGSISCFGIDIHALSKKQLSLFQRQHMGFVFQFGNLLSFLSVSENIAFPLSLNKVLNKKEINNRIAGLLEKVELSELSSAMPFELSGGEMQRIAFARAIAHSPKMLIADEPTANLDTETGNKLVKLMFFLAKEENCTIVLSTHDRDLIKLADKTIYLLDGRKIADE
ncbi:MAG: ABC transporter ATP-binding protein [Desulfobacteraceae bacterium]|nr:ABC transporter ATP-binding protein [Desulfobacteraceae bacterium]